MNLPDLEMGDPGGGSGREQGGRGTPHQHHALLAHHQSQAIYTIQYTYTPIAHSDPQADIISSFLSTVPAGFPLSPGAALAELTGLAPLSPGLGHNPSYHFSMSPRHQVFIVTL